MKQQEQYWIMKNGVKTYIQTEKKVNRMSNKEASIDYEMEQILADISMGRTNDDKYYQHTWNMSKDLK